MRQLSLGRVLGVYDLTRYLKELLDSDPVLASVWVRGEVSNFRHHTSGHMYFTLKDERSALRCVMFRSRNQALTFLPQDGMRVVAGGYVSVYERDGVYQLYVEEMQPDGLGALHQAFLRLKEKLEKEGLFDFSRKRPLPLLPRCLGVVTSLTGAALQDILTVARRRLPCLDIVVAPVRVQGAEAPGEICRALELMNAWGGADVIIVGRGGGSLEELWAFNDEAVARAIYASRAPVVSAVGHQTDITIADLVADLRAPTPSAAAEQAVPDGSELGLRLDSLGSRLIGGIRERLGRWRSRLDRLALSPGLARPLDRVWQGRQRVDGLGRRLVLGWTRGLKVSRARLDAFRGRLSALSPLSVLERGYSICLRQDGRPVTRLARAEVGDQVAVVLYDGELGCRVGSKTQGRAALLGRCAPDGPGQVR
ncbi:MAG: exodeoxyribonuclease VII large subunit [Acetobacteraceae bacterium]|nr:exodeoxyribonuclease VII large subunit [Acetobacteraceae bacterium]